MSILESLLQATKSRQVDWELCSFGDIKGFGAIIRELSETFEVEVLSEKFEYVSSFKIRIRRGHDSITISSNPRQIEDRTQFSRKLEELYDAVKMSAHEKSPMLHLKQTLSGMFS
jgi:hypothetical protein